MHQSCHQHNCHVTHTAVVPGKTVLQVMVKKIYSVICLGLKEQRRPTLVNYGVHLTKWKGGVVVACGGING